MMKIGITTSKKERQTKNLNSVNLTYGEVEFTSISEIFEFIREEYNVFQTPGGIFTDLGSGIGKGIITGALMHEFEECVGIEILEDLYQKSTELRDVYYEYMNKILKKKSNPFDYASVPELKLSQADILEQDWSNSDFILINSTWFDIELINRIYEKSRSWKEGAWMLTVTKKLPPNDEWELILQTKKPMSWAPATINLYRKIK